MKQNRTHSFIPYLMLVFFNTFIDIGHKILIQDTLYQTANSSEYTVYSAIINALILLPYILLFTPSGFIADRFSKAIVLRITALISLPLTLLVCLCYFQGYFWGAYALTLLMAVQSVLNSPAKYGYIKEIFGKEQLSKVNAIVQTLTIISILSATFAFTYIFSHYLQQAGLQNTTDKSMILKSFAPAGFLLVIFSVFETLMTLRLIRKDAVDPQSRYEVKKYFKGIYLKSYLEKTRHPKMILNAIFGLSVFWALNQVLLASYGAYLKENVGNVSVLFAQGSLAIGGIGILLGALYAGRRSRGSVEMGLIPLATIGIAAGLYLLPHATAKLSILSIFLGYGFFGGILIVPLNALIQFNAPKSSLGKILAANNFLQNCFMFGFLVLTVILSKLKVDSRYLLDGLFFIALVGCIHSLLTMPQSLMRYLLYVFTSKFYSVSVHQLENLPSSGGVLLLGNHVSFVDWAILQIASPRPIRFVMDRNIFNKRFLNGFFKMFKVIPISKGASQQALKEVKKALDEGEVVAIFPEGRLSKNGQMGYFHTGFERAALGTNAQIIPFYIHGLWGSKRSYASSYQSNKYRKSNRRVHVVFGKALDTDSKASQVRQKVRELSITAWKLSIEQMSNIQSEWLYQAKKGGKETAIIDHDDRIFSCHQVLAISLFIKQKLKAYLKHDKNIGIIMPTQSFGIMANLAVLCQGKTVVNLNYSACEEAILHAIADANIKHIISSRRFISKLKRKGMKVDNLENKAKWIFIEDIISNKDKKTLLLYALIVKLLPNWIIKALFFKKSDISDTAAILFSSGSEGRPKGIELSHANILSNIQQMSSVIGLQDDDRVLNSLPLFHAFGLTVTSLLPLLARVPMVCVPDPTQTLPLAKKIFKHRVSLYCSTSTLLHLMCRNTKIHPRMLSSLRLVIAGAEKLSQNVSREFKEKFGLEIYEGYGATEVAPVASCNLPDVISSKDWHVHQANKKGTVGLPLPGCAFKVVDPVTLKEQAPGASGLILIGGTQVMKGYLNDDLKTDEVMIHEDDYSWYKTGDKGYLDEDGFLTIVDRYSRFAKIAGEMISLTQVEEAWRKGVTEEHLELMALAVKDERKGERLILIYEGEQNEDVLRRDLLQLNLPNMMLPAVIKKVDALPRLGSGKKDYVQAKAIYFSS